MKAKERHQLKQNDFAETTRRVVGALNERRRPVAGIVVAAIAVLAVIIGVFAWRSSQANSAGALLGVAMATAQARIAPASTLPGAAQVSGTYPTEKARSEAALKAYQDVIAAYPSTDAGTAATYEAAGELLDLGRASEAEEMFNKVIAANSDLYTPMARLGLAQSKFASGKFEEAATLYTALSAERDGPLPVDGVLMQLAQAYERAGKPEDARAAYKRVVDEFSDSPYATRARQQLGTAN